MAWRAIKDTVPHSVSLSYITAGAERLYWRMLAISDPHGRLEGSATKVRARALPLVRCNDTQVTHWLEELQTVNRVFLYEASGKQFAQIVDFDQNQPTDFLRKRGASIYPDPLGETAANTDQSGTTPELGGEGRPSGSLEGEGELEGDREGNNQGSPNGEPRRKVEDEARQVYEYWRERLGKTDSRYNKIAPNRRQKIQARLREFTGLDLKRAIDGVALDPWEERPRHDDLTVIFRSQEQVERFLAIAEHPPAKRKRGLTPEEIRAGGKTP